MGVFVRHAETKLFFVGRDLWVAESGQARVFQGIAEAIDAIQAEDLQQVEVVVRHREPTCELALPIQRDPFICGYQSTQKIDPN